MTICNCLYQLGQWLLGQTISLTSAAWEVALPERSSANSL